MLMHLGGLGFSLEKRGPWDNLPMASQNVYLSQKKPRKHPSVRGIVVGDVLRRLFWRTVAQQFHASG